MYTSIITSVKEIMFLGAFVCLFAFICYNSTINEEIFMTFFLVGRALSKKAILLCQRSRLYSGYKI